MAAEQRCTKECVDDISANVVELKNRSIDMEPTESVLVHICQRKCVETSGVLDESQRRTEAWIDQMEAVDKLTTGISFYEGNARVDKDYVKAARYLNASLEAGKWEANYCLGMLYQKGKGVQRCNVTAVEHFENGIHAKDAKAMTALEQCYMLGAGVSACIKMASAYEDPVAMSIRSNLKLNCYYTEGNPSLAYQLAKKSVEKGHKRAKMNLAKCCMHGLTLERNAAKAVQLGTEALKAGALSQLTELAECYEQGNSVEVDYRKAVELYKKGTEFTSNSWRRAHVQPYYGRCLIQERGVPKDVRRGWGLIQNSIRLNFGSRWHVQAECYRHGYGVKRNMKKAVESYLRASCSKESVFSRIRSHYALGCLYERDKGTVRNLEKAFEHFEYSANRMHREAQWKIALFCESGFGVEQNLARAAEYYGLESTMATKNHNLRATNITLRE